VVILDLILIGLAVTLEPIPLTAFILILSARRGSVKGLEFIFGWLLSLVVVIAGVVLVTGGKPPKPKTAPSTAVLAVKLAIGVVLILIAVRQKRRAGRRRKPPTWMSKLDGLSGWAAAGLGAFLQPWALIAAGAASVVELHVSSIESYFLLVGFCLLCTASFVILELHVVLSPQVAQRRLEALRNWIDSHRDPAIIVLSLVLGFWLVGSSIYLIVS
jgi:threonine/homoserine/homoserine lactone efflux protein